VVQPYDYSMPWQDIAEELAATSRRPLEVHIPPVKLASIHSPGRCWFIVFTRPGHTMRWLPEQETGIAPPGSQIIQPPKRSTSGEVV
jgi:hypothetical protein